MHFDFHFTAIQVLWTLTFAAQLVLLVVLLGRDRTKRFKWFTISIIVMAMRLLASRLLFGRLPQITLGGIFVTLGDVAAVVSLLVVVEVARRSFPGLKPRAWMMGTVAMLAVDANILALWGPWPAWKTLTANSLVGVLEAMQLVAQKGDMLADLLAIELGLLVVLFGRRFHAGWRSHPQQIVVGLSTAAIARLAVQGIWQIVAHSAQPHSQAEYQRVVGLRDKLFDASGAIYVAVLVWWIVCLWINEPGTATDVDTPVKDAAPPEDGDGEVAL